MFCFQKYRQLLNGDLIHIRRPDMQSIDAFLHVRPFPGSHDPFRGLAMFFNPTSGTLHDNIEVSLYYTGLTTSALVSMEGRNPKEMTLSRSYTIQIPVTLKAKTFTWMTIQ